MALTILNRPKGYKLESEANVSYSITSDGYGTALLSGGSGLSNGDVIYIQNSFTSYQGFWILSSYGPGAFRMSRYTGADPVIYVQDHANVEVYVSVGEILASCVHLPIVYTLRSNLWPLNTSDPIRNIVGYANDNGYVRITLSAAIDINALDWLNIQATSEDSLDGPFQVLTKYSNTQYTIDAPYSTAATSPYTYASATAQKYYNNYHANVRIYGGLKPDHEHAQLKPYVLITELSIPTDADNLVKVNVAEALKEQIQILLNRPNYDSMPYDLDRFCEFYISYAEQYDTSNGIDVTTLIGSYQSDYDFLQGLAVDAELPFKNRYSGFLSEYVYAPSQPAKFLSDGVPMLFEGNYFDLSFINSLGIDLVVVQALYNQYDVLLSTTETPYPTINSRGVIRLPLSAIGSETYQIVTLQGINDDLSADAWVNGTYQLSNKPFASITNDGIETILADSAITPLDNFSAAHQVIPVNLRVIGRPFTVVMDVQSSILDGSVFLNWSVWSQAGFLLNSSGESILSNGRYTLTVTAGGTTPYALEVRIFNNNISTDISATVTIASQGGPFSEQKRIDINQDCAKEYIYLTWKNHLGGFNYWLFTSNKDYGVNVLETQERQNNIYPQWPHSFGEHQDTINQETYRSSVATITVRAENLTKEQAEFIKGIRTSSLVQQMTSKYDRRTMSVDADSFKVRTDNEGLINMEFVLRDTANIPSQAL